MAAAKSRTNDPRRSASVVAVLVGERPPAEGEDLQGGIGARAEEDTEGGQEGEKEVEHEPMVVTTGHASNKSVAGC
jgi:hypothetical protein